jgi:gamma-glutamyltranspeptidase/glutathione hydrolase
MIRAAQAAFEIGDPAVAEPRTATPSPEELLSAKGVRTLRSRMEKAPPKAMNSGGTAVVSVVDAEGNAAIIVQSIFLVFGSFVSDAETGILLNNRMIGFCTEAGHPNQVGPKKRPAHTLCPAMAFEGGELRMVLGTPGGPGQTITLTQLLENRYALGMPLAQAIEAPRWSKDLGADIVLEATLPETLAGELGKLGIAAGRTTPDSPYFGSAEAIERAPDGTLTGAADFRRDAFAIGG